MTRHKNHAASPPPPALSWVRGFVIFLPLLIIYLFIAATGWHATPVQDEPNYLFFAENLTRGTYSPGPKLRLWHGPGYPLFLTPFVAVGLGPGMLRLLNAPLLFVAVVFFHRFLRNLLRRRHAVMGAYALGLYWPIWKMLPVLMTEVLAVCLMCLLLWSWSELRRRERFSTKWLLIASAAFAWLCCTRTIFGYALVAAGLAAAAYVTLTRRRRDAARVLLVFLLALLLCVPWLAYTHSRTGKWFYWCTAGHLSLYWMTNPQSDEWGDCYMADSVLGNPALAPHHDLFRSTGALDEVAFDEEVRKAALRNLRDHPASYAKNVAANISRLFFSFPYSHEPQKLSTLFYALPNAILLTFLLLASVAFLRNPRATWTPLYPYLLLAGAASCGTTLLSAYSRMLDPLIPVFLVFIFHNLRDLRLRCVAPEDASR